MLFAIAQVFLEGKRSINIRIAKHLFKKRCKERVTSGLVRKGRSFPVLEATCFSLLAYSLFGGAGA